MKVMQAFNVSRRYKRPESLGIEIEVEGEDLPRPPRYWRCEEDGSLRGESVEYVLKRPMTPKEVGEAIKHLEECYINNRTVVHESVRAGVHVHVNVQDLEVVQLFNFMTAYIILEDLLVKFCGEYREGNLFCLRMKDADYLLYEIERVAKSKEYYQLKTDMLRYASMNVKSLFSYGSLEFRAMRGTRDLSLIELWANVLLKLRDVSMTYENPKSIVDSLVEGGAESFLETFLGDFLPKLTNHPIKDLDLSEGLLRAQGLAYEVDWDSYKTISIGGVDFPLGTEYPDEPLTDY